MRRQELAIPENIDNCVHYCPKGTNVMAVTKHGSDLVALCINGKCPGPQIIECIDGETGRVAILATCGASSGILEFNVGEVEEDEDETWFAKDDRSDIFRRQIDQAELRSKQRQITDWGKE